MKTQEIAKKANQGYAGKLAFNDGLANIQGSVVDELINLSSKLTKNQMSSISTLIRVAMANAYKMGFVRGADVADEMTQNGFISLMYDCDYKELGSLINSDLLDLTNPVKF